MHDDVSTSIADAPSAEALFATRIAGEVARKLYEDGQELHFCLVPIASASSRCSATSTASCSHG